MPKQAPQKIAIIGGGPVGAMTAAFLAEQGHEIHLFERRPDLRKTDISAGRSINLALANRGITPLRRLGLMPEIEKMIIPMKGRMIHDPEGNTHLQPYGQKDHEVIYSISRGDLNALLLTKAESYSNLTSYFHHQCDHLDLDNNSATFTDTLSDDSFQFSFDRIIGADGAGSIVRSAVIDKSSNPQDTMEPLDHSYKELHIPPSKTGGFQMEREALHIWPRGGFMLIALPNIDGSFTVTLFLQNEGTPSFDELNTKDTVHAFFQEHFADALALIPDLVDSFFDNPTGHLATVRCLPWVYKDKALLIGDAAHAIVPFHGQGMNAGFEDAGVLANLTNEHTDWHVILNEYQALRKPNGDAIADMALENYIEMRDSVTNPIFLQKKAIGFQLEKKYPELFTPRYSMVMFGELPYEKARELGERNDRILSELIAKGSTPDNIDWRLAESLLNQ